MADTTGPTRIAVCPRHLAENKKETACLVLVKVFALAECFIKKSGEDPVNTDNFAKRLSVNMDGIRQITGSRYSNGNVPNVNWNDGEMNINWYNSSNSNDNLRSRQKFSKEEIPLKNKVEFLYKYSYIYFKYFIQPFVILEISCRLSSSSIYSFLLIIFNSCEILRRVFNNSTFIRAEFNEGNFSILESNAAVINKSIISKQIFSILEWIPKRSRLDILNEIR